MSENRFLPPIEGGGSIDVDALRARILAAMTGNGSSVAPREIINGVAAKPQDQQLTVAAANAPLRLIYGRVRLGAQLADMVPFNGGWIVIAVWGQGPVCNIESVTLGDNDLPAGVSVTHYLGDAGNIVDPALIAAYAAQDPPVTYADGLPGIAYSVFTFPAGVLAAGVSLNAIVRGFPLRDPRSGLTLWSDNAALALAHYLTDPGIGCGFAVADADIAACANACDDVLDGVGRRRIGLAIDSVQPIENWIEALRTYAGCFVIPEGDTLRLVPDRPAAPVATIRHEDGQIRSISPLKLRGRAGTPTHITITYTDTTKIPWKEARVVAQLPGVAEGTVARRESIVALFGIQCGSQAYREVVERLNKLTLCDLSCVLEVFDEGLRLQPGNVVIVSHPWGLIDKLMRIVSMSGELGRYTLALVEYDPAAYSDAIIVDPTTPDTTLPNPAAPPAPTGLVLSEEVFQLDNGTWSSHIRATWDAPVYTYLRDYRVEVWAGGSILHSASTTLNAWASPAVVEGVQHTVRVACVSTIAAASLWASADITAQGKLLPPGVVPSLAGIEVGGEVRLSWSPAIDIDIWRYEVRWGAVGVAWDAAVLLDRVEALRLSSRDIPVGTWDFLVCAQDSVRQYSAAAGVVAPARKTLTVTLDSNAFLADHCTFTAPVVSGMLPYTLSRTDGVMHYVSDGGNTVANKWGADAMTVAAAVGTLANLYGDNGSIPTFTTEAHDFGLALTGNWSAAFSDWSILGGSAAQSILLSTDGSAYTPYPGTSVKATARFAKLQISAAAANRFRVAVPDVALRIDAVPRQEVGAVTTAASGPTTVLLANAYSAVKSIQLTPQGTSGKQASFDNVRINGFAACGAMQALQFDNEIAAGSTGNQFWYREIFSSSRLTLAGDYFEFDALVVKAPPGASSELYVGIYSTDSVWIAIGTVGMTPGVWQPIKLAMLAGKTPAKHAYINECNAVGQYSVLLRNLRITDGAGTVRQTVWSSGAPYSAEWNLSGGQINYGVNRANAFDIYCFNSSGAQIAAPVSYSYEGV